MLLLFASERKYQVCVFNDCECTLNKRNNATFTVILSRNSVINYITIAASVGDGGFWSYGGFVFRYLRLLVVVLLLSDYAVMKQWVSLCFELSGTF